MFADAVAVNVLTAASSHCACCFRANAALIIITWLVFPSRTSWVDGRNKRRDSFFCLPFPFLQFFDNGKVPSKGLATMNYGSVRYDPFKLPFYVSILHFPIDHGQDQEWFSSSCVGSYRSEVPRQTSLVQTNTSRCGSRFVSFVSTIVRCCGLLHFSQHESATQALLINWVAKTSNSEIGTHPSRAHISPQIRQNNTAPPEGLSIIIILPRMHETLFTFPMRYNHLLYIHSDR